MINTKSSKRNLVVTFVILLITVCLISSWYYYSSRESTMTMQKFLDKFNLPNQRNFHNGSQVEIHDVVKRIEVINSSYGQYTFIYFPLQNASYSNQDEFPLAVKGDQSNSIQPNMQFNIKIHLSNYTIFGHSMIMPDEFIIPDILYLRGNIDFKINTLTPTSSNNVIKIVTNNITLVRPIQNYSITIYNEALDVDELNLRNETVSLHKYIQFNDSNQNGMLDNGDYFILSFSLPNNNFVIRTITLTLKGPIYESLQLHIWNNGYFYVS